MGVAASTSVNTLVQQTVNDTYQSAQAECTADCVNIQSGNVVVIDNTTTGDITFTQKCTAEASCYMSNSLDSLVQAYQDAQLSGSASPALFPGIQINTTVNTSVQELRNELTQVMTTLCNSNSTNIQEGNIVYATNSTTGDIAFVQEGNAESTCVMENIGRAKANLSQTGDLEARTGGAVGGITGIIVAIIVVIIIIYAVVRFNKTRKQVQKGGLQSVLGGSTPAPSTQTSPTSSNISNILSTTQSSLGTSKPSSSSTGGVANLVNALSSGSRRGISSFGK